MTFSSTWHCPLQPRSCNRGQKNAGAFMCKLGADLEHYWKSIVAFSFMRKCFCYRLPTNHQFSSETPHNPGLLRTNVANDLMSHVQCISSPCFSNASCFSQFLSAFLWSVFSRILDDLWRLYIIWFLTASASAKATTSNLIRYTVYHKLLNLGIPSFLLLNTRQISIPWVWWIQRAHCGLLCMFFIEKVTLVSAMI